MIIRLHNLSARAPKLSDLCAVVKLIKACSTTEEGDVEEEELHRSWIVDGFGLHTDAWVVYERQGEIVGYADLHGQEGEQAFVYVLYLRVHPDYQGRGIEKLLIWLVEERARQMMDANAEDLRVVLETAVDSRDQEGQELYEEEEYQLARTCWRVVLNVGEDGREPDRADSLAGGTFKMDFVIDACSLVGTMSAQKCADIHTVQQYKVYEKVLRCRSYPILEEVLVRQQVSV